MVKQRRIRLFIAFSLLALFAGCESRYGPGPLSTGNAAPTPTSSSPVPPTVSAPVVIFAEPTPQQYAAVGASTTSAGDGEPVGKGARLTNVSLAAYDQPSIRYASGYHEIQLPGMPWDRLGHYRGLMNPTADNNFFQPARAAQNHATFIIRQSRLEGYNHSEVASWTNIDVPPAQVGFVAFGTPTPVADIPAVGSATYRGSVVGIVDITYFNGLYGGDYFDSVAGTVTLTVDFANRTLTGNVELDVAEQYPAEVVIPSTGSVTGLNGFSGLFDSDQTGFNQFKVTLTGSNATEVIGSWAVPIRVAGESHQLMGAWIGKRE